MWSRESCLPILISKKWFLRDTTMPSLISQLESILFVANRPLSVKKLSEVVAASPKDVEVALHELFASYRDRNGGMTLTRVGSEYQFMTAGENAEAVGNFIREEFTGELSRPSLEALTIIAYRGPVTKAEIEQIRGVNCSLILRNLMIRGLIEAAEDKALLLTRYRITHEFLRYLGLREASELPDYARLSADHRIEQALAAAKPA